MFAAIERKYWYPYPISFLDFLQARKDAKKVKTARTAESSFSHEQLTEDEGPSPNTVAQEPSDGTETLIPRRESIEVGVATTSTTSSADDEHIPVLTAAVGKLQANTVDQGGVMEPGRGREGLGKVEEGTETKRNDSLRPKVAFGGVTVGVDGPWVNGSQMTRQVAAAHRWPAGLARSSA